VKLFKTGVSRRLSRHEARVTRAVFAAGGPALAVLDEVTLEGRFGIVFDRLAGPTLLQLLRSGAMTPAQTGAILASLYMSVHKTPPPPDVLSLRDWLAALRLQLLWGARGALGERLIQLIEAAQLGGLNF
jgi:hypothetical protein